MCSIHLLCSSTASVPLWFNWNRGWYWCFPSSQTFVGFLIFTMLWKMSEVSMDISFAWKFHLPGFILEKFTYLLNNFMLASCIYRKIYTHSKCMWCQKSCVEISCYRKPCIRNSELGTSSFLKKIDWSCHVHACVVLNFKPRSVMFQPIEINWAPTNRWNLGLLSKNSAQILEKLPPIYISHFNLPDLHHIFKLELILISAWSSVYLSVIRL